MSGRNKKLEQKESTRRTKAQGMNHSPRPLTPDSGATPGDPLNLRISMSNADPHRTSKQWLLVGGHTGDDVTHDSHLSR